MSDSISERVFEAIVDQLATILEDNDYATNAGRHVFRTRRNVDPSQLPCIVVFDGGESADPATAGGRDLSMSIEQTINIEIHAEADSNETGKMVGRLKSDVKRCLLGNAARGALVDATCSKLGGILIYAGSVPQVREEGAQSESCQLTFIAKYRETYGDPATTA